MAYASLATSLRQAGRLEMMRQVPIIWDGLAYEWYVTIIASCGMHGSLGKARATRADIVLTPSRNRIY